MAQVIVRNLEDDIKEALKHRARQHGWSTEEEIRQILRRAVNETPTAPVELGSRIAARFTGTGLDEPLPELRGDEADPMPFDT
ncbi:FitA-like ribbon-helix-helix domain-containing protein [Halorhodospira neutriphila]|uniref:FitA-like ribbon-helix-helix domain-containing protein n=1 Tax=Halorhodospira neutriphila TaxID=168379 RepID=UPI00190559F7|nr:toxin-antitoxin system [Halorhodospira neutriphila]